MARLVYQIRADRPSASLSFQCICTRLVALLLAASTAGVAATLTVGPSGQYSTPCSAFAAASSGDTIEIDTTGNYDGDVCAVRPNNLTIRGIGGRARIDAAGKNAEGKGIWVIKGNNTRVENIEFSGAAVPDRNGAGIRQEGVNLVVRNCYFHDNENGILTGASASSEILVEYSEFDNNGAGDGYSHNMYIGHVAKFTLRFCYSHHARVGHLVKTRAAENYILYNRLSDEATGTASYELNIPNGGKSFVIGNIIHQGPATGNGSILRYREEGPHVSNPSTELFIVNNTFVNERPGPTTFINIAPEVQTPALIANNIFVGAGTVNTQGIANMTGNLSGADPLFADPANYDYHLRWRSPAIDAGQDPGTAEEVPLTPSFAYIHPACGEGRQTFGGIDAGAYEFGGSGFNADAPDRCRMISEGGIVSSASFLANPLAPGSIISIFGPNLAAEVRQATAVPLPTSLGGTSVTVDGVPAPLFYVSPSQLNVQLPFEVSPGQASAVVNVGGVPTRPATFAVAQCAPAIFFYGDNHAVAQNADYSLNSSQNPAAAGTLITVYLTGQGPLTVPVTTGAPAPIDPLAWASLPYSATIGGQNAEVTYLVLTPTLVGLLQAGVKVPDLPGGDYPLVMTVGGVASSPVTLSVSGP